MKSGDEKMRGLFNRKQYINHCKSKLHKINKFNSSVKISFEQQLRMSSKNSFGDKNYKKLVKKVTYDAERLTDTNNEIKILSKPLIIKNTE